MEIKFTILRNSPPKTLISRTFQLEVAPTTIATLNIAAYVDILLRFPYPNSGLADCDDFDAPLTFGWQSMEDDVEAIVTEIRTHPKVEEVRRLTNDIAVIIRTKERKSIYAQLGEGCARRIEETGVDKGKKGGKRRRIL